MGTAPSITTSPRLHIFRLTQAVNAAFPLFSLSLKRHTTGGAVSLSSDDSSSELSDASVATDSDAVSFTDSATSGALAAAGTRDSAAAAATAEFSEDAAPTTRWMQDGFVELEEIFFWIFVTT